MARNDTPRSFRFTAVELAKLEAAKEKHGGSYKAAIMAGLEALEGKKPITQDQVIDWIRRNAK